VRTRLQPAHGTARWLDHLDPVSGNQYLAIEVETSSGLVCQEYEVERHETFILLYFLDQKTWDLRSYKVETRQGEAWTCTCPDHKHRPERYGCCKHIGGLRAALASLPL
jgi:hypothetical protein